jgi:hypothetical protein
MLEGLSFGFIESNAEKLEEMWESNGYNVQAIE